MARALTRAAALYLLWCGAAAELGGGAPEADLPLAPDDDCAASETCSLHLRQLRAGRGAAAAEAADDPPDPPLASEDTPYSEGPPSDGEEPSPPAPGAPVPGGWGEPAGYVARLEAGVEEANATFRENGAACSVIGCNVAYDETLSCQCNSECQKFGNCCGDFHGTCQQQGNPSSPKNVLTLFHQTGFSAGPLILANGFKPGRSGWCGGGIYFATNKRDTNRKAIGPQSHKGYMIEAQVDVGRVKQMPRRCGWTTGDKLAAEGFDSVSFNPGDGVEYVVYDNARVLSTRRVSL